MYPEAKVYNDGSHYLAIPHKKVPSKRRIQKPEEEAIIYEENETSDMDENDYDASSNSAQENTEMAFNDTETQDKDTNSMKTDKKEKRTGETKSEIFNRLFEQTREMKKHQRKAFIVKEMRKYFKSDERCKEYVADRFERKHKNLINRRIRFARKANLNEFNYFVTFTRNDALNDEASFRKRLSRCLRNYHTNRDWTYMGVWEKSPSGRLHFHALLNIPEGTMPGKLELVRDFDKHTIKMQETYQNTFFNRKFGRNDFASLPNNARAKAMAIRYLTKYLEKSGEKIVYSRGLPMYLISDIEEKDILARMKNEYGEKFVLHDNFSCWDEGCYIGEMNDKTKKQLRTANH